MTRIYCVFCEQKSTIEYKELTPEILEEARNHMLTCEKHPLHAAVKRIEELGEENKRLKKAYLELLAVHVPIVHLPQSAFEMREWSETWELP